MAGVKKFENLRMWQASRKLANRTNFRKKRKVVPWREQVEQTMREIQEDIAKGKI